MTSNYLTRAQRVNHVRRIECYPDIGREDDEFEELEEENDDTCDDGYPVDPAFGSWSDVNSMFI